MKKIFQKSDEKFFKIRSRKAECGACGKHVTTLSDVNELLQECSTLKKKEEHKSQKTLKNLNKEMLKCRKIGRR
jgi:hypothetical protein